MWLTWHSVDMHLIFKSQGSVNFFIFVFWPSFYSLIDGIFILCSTFIHFTWLQQSKSLMDTSLRMQNIYILGSLSVWQQPNSELEFRNVLHIKINQSLSWQRTKRYPCFFFFVRKVIVPIRGGATGTNKWVLRKEFIEYGSPYFLTIHLYTLPYVTWIMIS